MITSAYGRYKLAGDNPDDWPELPKEVSVQELSLHSDLIGKALAHTIFATSNDDLRPAMQGVLVQIESKNVTFVATDAHKLVKYTFKMEETLPSGKFILPK